MATTNLPGVLFEYKDDGRLVPVITGPITDTVLIIGNAVDGPINTPVRVNSKTVEQLFGPVVYNAIYASPAGDRDFGRYNGNNLVKAYAEVSQGGCTDVILMRVGDSTHTVAASSAPCTGETYQPKAAPTGTEAVSAILGIEIKAKYPGSVYDGIGMKLTYTATTTDKLTSATLTVRQDLKKKGRVIEYVINKGSGTTLTRRELINRINSDLRNFSIVASSLDGVDVDTVVPLDTKTASKTDYWVLNGGTDGTRKDFGTAAAVYEALMGWADDSDAKTAGVIAEDSPFAKLESLEVDVVYMSALYADENIGTVDKPMTIARPLAEAVHNASKNEYPMVGVVGNKPATDAIPAKVGTIVDNLIQEATAVSSDAIITGTDKLKMGWFVSKDTATGDTKFSDYVDPDTNEKIDLGRYVLCVPGPDVVISNPKLGQYLDSGAGVVAGLLTTVPPHRTITNMVVPGVRQMAYAFTNKQLNKIVGGQPFDSVTGDSGSGGSYVVFRKNANGDIVVTLDNTCACRDSDYASYQVFYIVNMVASGLKKVVEPFIGMAAHATTKTALDNQVKKFLDMVAETRAIAGGEGVGYNLDITATGVDQLLGRININLQLRPALQIKMINVSISVAPPSGS